MNANVMLKTRILHKKKLINKLINFFHNISLSEIYFNFEDISTFSSAVSTVIPHNSSIAAVAALSSLR